MSGDFIELYTYVANVCCRVMNNVIDVFAYVYGHDISKICFSAKTSLPGQVSERFLKHAVLTLVSLTAQQNFLGFYPGFLEALPCSVSCKTYL